MDSVAGLKTLEQVANEVQTYEAKLKNIEQKKAALLDEEHSIRVHLQHLEIQKHRLLGIESDR